MNRVLIISISLVLFIIGIGFVAAADYHDPVNIDDPIYFHPAHSLVKEGAAVFETGLGGGGSSNFYLAGLASPSLQSGHGLNDPDDDDCPIHFVPEGPFVPTLYGPTSPNNNKF